MRILLDECVDRRLARDLTPHFVSTVPRCGWSGVKNGRLLALAQMEFDIFLTVDANIPAEQNLKKFQIAVVLLRVQSNRLGHIRPLVPRILDTISEAAPGRVHIVAPA